MLLIGDYGVLVVLNKLKMDMFVLLVYQFIVLIVETKKNVQNVILILIQKIDLKKNNFF